MRMTPDATWFASPTATGMSWVRCGCATAYSALEMGVQTSGGTAGIETDRFDAHCEHLILEDTQVADTPQVVGTYRILGGNAHWPDRDSIPRASSISFRSRDSKTAAWKLEEPAWTGTIAAARPRRCFGPGLRPWSSRVISGSSSVAPVSREQSPPPSRTRCPTCIAAISLQRSFEPGQLEAMPFPWR